MSSSQYYYQEVSPTVSLNNWSDNNIGLLPIPTTFSIDIAPAILSLNIASTTKPLGTSYEPGDHDVVCGRGKGAYNRPGNKKFRALLMSYIPRYQAARTKVDKSILLDCIIDDVRALNNSDGRPAQFVKRERGCWVEIGDALARQKVGHAIREAMQVLQ